MTYRLKIRVPPCVASKGRAYAVGWLYALAARLLARSHVGDARWVRAGRLRDKAHRWCPREGYLRMPSLLPERRVRGQGSRARRRAAHLGRDAEIVRWL